MHVLETRLEIPPNKQTKRDYQTSIGQGVLQGRTGNAKGLGLVPVQLALYSSVDRHDPIVFRLCSIDWERELLDGQKDDDGDRIIQSTEGSFEFTHLAPDVYILH